jgi:hypothetical protein
MNSDIFLIPRRNGQSALIWQLLQLWLSGADVHTTALKGVNRLLWYHRMAFGH